MNLSLNLILSPAHTHSHTIGRRHFRLQKREGAFVALVLHLHCLSSYFLVSARSDGRAVNVELTFSVIYAYAL